MKGNLGKSCSKVRTLGQVLEHFCNVNFNIKLKQEAMVLAAKWPTSCGTTLIRLRLEVVQG